jgi:hypothetical protein
MLAPLATLAFLATLWLVNLVVADLLDRGLGKIAAALRGQSAFAMAPALRPVAVRVSQRSRAARPLHARPQLRADLRAAA